jgi:hypothetical protein
LHLLNYNYKNRSSIDSIPVTWRMAERKNAVTARLLRPGRAPENLAVTGGDGSRIHFVVPLVEMYAVVVVS